MLTLSLKGAPMAFTVAITLPGNDREEESAELRSLTMALDSSYIPQSTVTVRHARGAPEDMGVGTELLVYVGSSAGASGLAAALVTWIRSRQVTIGLERRRGKTHTNVVAQYSGNTPREITELLAKWSDEE